MTIYGKHNIRKRGETAFQKFINICARFGTFYFSQGALNALKLEKNKVIFFDNDDRWFIQINNDPDIGIEVKRHNHQHTFCLQSTYIARKIFESARLDFKKKYKVPIVYSNPEKAFELMLTDVQVIAINDSNKARKYKLPKSLTKDQ